MAYRKKTLASVADPFRENEEYLWYHHGLQTKKAMHGGGMRTVDPSISIHANKELLQEQKAEWDSRKRIIHNSGLADLMPHVSLTESFTGSVPQKVVGGKAYWHEAFIELTSMAQMYGVPEFFVTFTANEMGWGDLHNACRSKHFSEAPIEATRHYCGRDQS